MADACYGITCNGQGTCSSATGAAVCSCLNGTCMVVISLICMRFFSFLVVSLLQVTLAVAARLRPQVCCSVSRLLSLTCLICNLLADPCANQKCNYHGSCSRCVLLYCVVLTLIVDYGDGVVVRVAQLCARARGAGAGPHAPSVFP